MTQPLEQKKRQKILIGALIVVVIITVFVWYSNYRKNSIVLVEESELNIMPSNLKNIKLDLSVLDDRLFKLLKSFGLLPVTVGETGRDNPFEPY